MIKNCQSCNTKFDGRRDAKTCSVRCRKRFQRAKSAILHEAGVLKQDVEQAIDTLKGDIIPVRLAAAAADVPDEAGFIALEEQKQPYADSVWKPDYLDLPSASTFNSPSNPPLVETNPTSASIPVVPEPSPVTVLTPTVPTVSSVPETIIAPQPTILSLEDPQTVSETPAFLSSLATSAAPTPSLLSQVPASGSASPITPLPSKGQKESLKSKLQGRLRNTPLAANFAAIMVLILVGGVFAGAKLTHESAPGATIVNSESNTLVKQGDNILNINLDTVLANGKKLTLGQIVAGPGTSVLQVTGDVQSSGTLLASGGGSSLSNTGLKINNVIVCTITGCTSSTPAPDNLTTQGNIFNGPDQLVQLTGAGLIPVLSGINLTNLNGSNVASGTVADARLSTNVALLNGSQTFSGNPLFKNTTDSTTAFRIQDVLGNNLLLVDTVADRVTIVGLQGSGANLTDLNASNISSGTLADGRLSSNVSLLGASIESSEITDGTIVNADISATAAIADTKLATISTAGKVADSALSANVALLNGTGPQTFTGNNAFTGTFLAQNSVDSATAFQVQNAASNPYLLINTTGASISVGNTSIASTVQIGNTTGAVAQTIAIGNNATALSTSTVTIGNLLSTSATTIQGGIGASAIAIQAGASGTIAIGTTAVANAINIGDSLDTITLTGAAASTIVLNGVTISAAELNLLDGHDVALVDTNDAVATAIVGTGALDAGSITANFGSINTGADNITTTGTVQGTTSVLTSLLDTTAAGTLSVGTATATAVNIGNATGTTAVSVLCGTGTCGFGNNATDHSTVLGSATGTSVTTVNAGSGGLNLGNNGLANTIQIGTTTGAVAQTIAIGNNATALSSTTLTIGNIVAGTTTLQSAGGVAVSTLGSADSVTYLCRNAANLVASCQIAATGSAFIQGGNSFAATATLGTNDANSLAFETSNATQVTIAVGGATTFKNSADSATAFQIQNAASNPYLLVNTSGASVSLGDTSIASTVQIGNTTGGVAQTINIGNNATALSTTNLTMGNLLSTSATLIQGGTGASAIGLQAGTSGTISLGTTNINTVNIGSTSNTGTLTFGQATTGETINIGNGNVATGNTNTINIGATATSTGKDVITIGNAVAASSLSLQAGSGNILANATAGTITLQTTTSGAINIKPASVDGTNIVLGTSDTVGTQLVLDTKTTAGDPTCTIGGIYYNSSTNRFRSCEGSPTGWTDLGNPVGTILPYAAATAPDGYLIADGTAVSRTTYAKLFAIISTTYGTGDGATTFNLPDLRGRTLTGYAASGGHTDVATLGNNDGVALASRRPKHNHTFTQPTISSPAITVVQPTITKPNVTITDLGHSHNLGSAIVKSVGSGSVYTAGADGSIETRSSDSATTGITAALDSTPTASGGTATLASAPVATLGAAGVGGTACTDAGCYEVVNFIIKY